MPLHLCQPIAAISRFARFSIHFVAVVSAGPPFGGLYLKPPSSGGLCEGVITMPSACGFALVRRVVGQDRVRERRRRRIALAPRPIMISTPFAARTSSAVANAGSDSAWVSCARNSGPVVPCDFAVLHDRLRDRRDVVVVEAALERIPAMSRSPKRHALGRILRVRLDG